MTQPTLTISIDRTGMVGSPAALDFSATPGDGERGIVNYVDPRLVPQLQTLSADDIHGERLQSWKWQAAILGFDVVLDAAASEDEVTSLVDEIREAVSRMSFSVTVVKDGGTPQVWSCYVGQVNFKDARTRQNLTDHNPVIEVLIPCHPVRS